MLGFNAISSNPVSAETTLLHPPTELAGAVGSIVDLAGTLNYDTTLRGGTATQVGLRATLGYLYDIAGTMTPDVTPSATLGIDFKIAGNVSVTVTIDAPDMTVTPPTELAGDLAASPRCSKRRL